MYHALKFYKVINCQSSLNPCRITAKVLDSDLEVSEFKIQLRYYKLTWEKFEFPNPQLMGLN